MNDRTHIHDLLTPLALSLHDATELISDIREVRDRAARALHDLDEALVEDLLIFAAARLAAADVDVDALARQWSEAVLRSAALRLVESLNAISDKP